MKKLLLTACLSALGLAAFAQAAVSGNVLYSNSSAAANITVHVSIPDSLNSSNSFSGTATTNAAGHYSLNVPTNITGGNYASVWINDCISNNGAVINHNYAYNNTSITSNFSYCSSVQGHVSLGTFSGPAAYPATVYFISSSPDSLTGAYNLTLVDSSATNANGDYVIPMDAQLPGLLVKAALQPAAASYSSYLPTYFAGSGVAGSLNWSGAIGMTSAQATGTGVSIALIGGVNAGGPGFVGGSVLQGANKGAAVGDPLSKRILILTNATTNVPVAYTYTDAGGHFSFGSVPYGTYNVFGDAMGKQNPKLAITISAAQPSLPSLFFQENSTIFWGRLSGLSVGSVSIANDVFTAYPNPVQSTLQIAVKATTGNVKLTLTSITGMTVYSAEQAASSEIAIPVSNLAAGNYMLTVTTSAGTQIARIVKQ